MVGVADCCREYLEEAKRGGGNGDEENQEEDYSNLVLWYGCPPGSQVNADSTLAVDFFDQMK